MKGRRAWLGITVLAMVAALVPFLAQEARAVSTSLVINEIDYDQPGTDAAEYVELKNVSGGPIDLSAYSLELVNGTGGGASVYDTIALPAVSLAAGDYFVVCANAATVANCDLDDGPDTNFIQNGAPDAVALWMGTTLVDAVSYEGNSGAPYTEGSGSGLEDDSSVADAGISRCPDGVDTDQNNVDLLGSRPITPGAANNCPVVSSGPVINEFVANHTGADTEAFVEVFGDPDTDYSAFTVLEIEGDSTGAGTIDAALPVGTTDSGGYWTDPEDMENGTLTILLVEGFTGSVGSDLDTDNDGAFDSTPWTRVIDDVATTDGGSSDQVYSSTVLAPGFGGISFSVGGASRIPNGTDTNSTSDWLRNDFDGFGFPGFPGSPAIGEAQNTPGEVNVAITVLTDPFGECGDAATLIHDIQGNGSASPDVGNIREIEGIVTGVFDESGELGGFFMQEESAPFGGDFDGDPTTSEGIFVFTDGDTGVASGDTVRVRGTVTEFFGLTEISPTASVVACPATGTTTQASWSLPVSAVSDWEWVEGMEIKINQTLYASGNFTQARFGEVDLSVGGPLDNPTNVVAPGAAALALQDLNDRSRIQMDDGSTVQNPLPLPPYLGADNTLRTGDTLPGIVGNVGFSFGNYEIHPTGTVSFTRANARPDTPDVGGRLTVAAYNVLNYFTTIDNGSPICGPAGNQGCRGADTASEFTRQRDKIVTAISTLDADVVGLMEIENAPDNTPEADLVAGLNAATAPGTYDYIATGPVGGDAIRVALLYQPGAVTPFGDFAILDSSVDPDFNDDKNRAMLTQSFVENATGAIFTVAVNHLKSKGSPCNDVGDPDAGDGQGNCNVTRTNAAEAIVDYLASDPTGSGDADFLVIGDLNAYAMEDPIVALENGGYTDLIETFVGTGWSDGAYSFNFFSQSGYLDHGMANPAILPQVTGAAFWHVNADEPSGLDYNNFNQPGLYNPDEFRSSDHDPVVIGLDLATAVDIKEATALDLAMLLPTGNVDDDMFIQQAIKRIDQSLESSWWIDESTLDPKRGGRVFDREHQAVTQLEDVATVDVQWAIDAILTADRQLALKELLTAIAAGGNASRIAQAQGNLATAAANIAAGLYSDAVLDYKRAWTNAIKAQ